MIYLYPNCVTGRLHLWYIWTRPYSKLWPHSVTASPHLDYTLSSIDTCVFIHLDTFSVKPKQHLCYTFLTFRTDSSHNCYNKNYTCALQGYHLCHTWTAAFRLTPVQMQQADQNTCPRSSAHVMTINLTAEDLPLKHRLERFYGGTSKLCKDEVVGDPQKLL